MATADAHTNPIPALKNGKQNPNCFDIALPVNELKAKTGFIPGGLTQEEAEIRLLQYGLNSIAKEKKLSPLSRLWENLKNPLVILLTILGLVSWLTGDIRATFVIFVMVILGVVLRYFQEMRADNAAEKLKAMVSTHATVCRDGKNMEIALKYIVPGDIVQLGSGDMVPADIVLLTAKDLFVNQAALTGESLPIEKSEWPPTEIFTNPFELNNACFLGTNVESGTATALVVNTGDNTYFGKLAYTIVGERVLTSFDKGVNKFTWLMIRFMMIMVPAVFIINGISKHSWVEAFLFALAVAVGMTPEMLPMIVSVNLSKGALAMAKKKVIVKRLNAIQNFGAMDVLCTDKTGTITRGKIVLEQHIDAMGNLSNKVLEYGYLNSYFHTGLKNLLDDAVLEHGDLENDLVKKGNFSKIDEVPFDFVRKRMSVIVSSNSGDRHLICKGAVEGLIEKCVAMEINGIVQPIGDAQRNQSLQIGTSTEWSGFSGHCHSLQNNTNN